MIDKTSDRILNLNPKTPTHRKQIGKNMHIVCFQ